MNPLLKTIADNPNLFDALKEHLLKKFDDVVPSEQLLIQDDFLLGQLFRARITGRQMVEEAFREIGRLRSGEIQSEAVNPAR